MSSVEREIEKSLTRKKSIIKMSIVGLILVSLLAAGIALLFTLRPDVSGGKVPSTPNSAGPENSPGLQTLSDSERKALQQALKQTSDNIRPMIETSQSLELFLLRGKKLADKMSDAYHQYEGGDYSGVKALLTEIQNDHAALTADYERAYTEPQQAAQNAFDENNRATAAELNRESLSMNPNYAPALKLQKRIDVFDDVQDAYEQARIGGVENNVEKQLVAYRKIISLDPQQTEAQNKLALLSKRQQDGQFRNYVALANSAIAQGKFTQARQHLNDAERVKPGSQEVMEIRDKVNQRVAESELAKIEKQVSLFVQSDEWPTVKMLAEKGIKRFPGSPTLQTANKNAQQVVEASRTLEQYRASPGRLTDPNVRQLALNTIASYAALAPLSAKLNQQMNDLSVLIEQVNEPVPVTITSDNDTYIKVLGVGVVGEVESKIISLTPGIYKVQGSRSGYRSTIRELTVSPSDTPISLHIACTEKV